jgi:hypothetical protein
LRTTTSKSSDPFEDLHRVEMNGPPLLSLFLRDVADDRRGSDQRTVGSLSGDRVRASRPGAVPALPLVW